MHSKGVYLMNIPSAIQHNDKPHQIVADYLAAVLCHDIQTNSSYLKTIPRSFVNVVNSTLKKISNLKILCDIITNNNNISSAAANDIANTCFVL